MNAAEMRARVTVLGLSLNQLSEIGRMDLRGLRRQSNGTTPVTPKTASTVQRLETIAKSLREEFLSASEVVLPEWKSTVKGDPDLPASFYYAVAGSVADHVTIRYAED